MFNTPRLRPAFSDTGTNRPQEPEEPMGLLDPLKAFAVARLGPAVVKKLDAAYENVMTQHTENGRAKDVTTHFMLQAMGKRVDSLRDHIMQGGAQGYGKMKEAARYLTRIEKLGLNA